LLGNDLNKIYKTALKLTESIKI